MKYIGMIDIISTIESSPLGTSYNFADVDMSQKQLSIMLSTNGWKKDYNNSGWWTRVTLWPYLTYYEGLKQGIPYGRLRVMEHIARHTSIMNKDVHLYAGMRLTQPMIDKIMTSLGWKKKDEIWYKSLD